MHSPWYQSDQPFLWRFASSRLKMWDTNQFAEVIIGIQLIFRVLAYRVISFVHLKISNFPRILTFIIYSFYLSYVRRCKQYAVFTHSPCILHTEYYSLLLPWSVIPYALILMDLHCRQTDEQLSPIDVSIHPVGTWCICFLLSCSRLSWFLSDRWREWGNVGGEHKGGGQRWSHSYSGNWFHGRSWSRAEGIYFVVHATDTFFNSFRLVCGAVAVLNRLWQYGQKGTFQLKKRRIAGP